MTQTITDPTEIAAFIERHVPDHVVPTLADMSATIELTSADEPTGCIRNLTWCAGECDEDEENPHHGSPLRFTDASRWQIRDRGHWTPTDMSVTVFCDETAGAMGTPRISLITADLGGEELALRPDQARRLAALLLDSADDADPIPNGILLLAASQLRSVVRVRGKCQTCGVRHRVIVGLTEWAEDAR